MILESKIVEYSQIDDNNYLVGNIQISLGNLGLHNASGIYVIKDPQNYPISWFHRIDIVNGEREETCLMIPDKPENCPDDYTIHQQYDSPIESLLDYAIMIKRDHEDVSDKRLAEFPNGRFHGYKRNARWHDEALRRELIT